MYNRKKQLKSEAVADELRRKILSGGFPDKRLPRKDELTEYFQVSQKTMEAALKMLTAEGLIRGVKGTGIFVNGDQSDSAAGHGRHAAFRSLLRGFL